MTEVIGTHNTAIVFTDNLEEKSRGQIESLCNMAEFADSKIRIMSDVHAGAGCTIGTTMTITNRVVPGIRRASPPFTYRKLFKSSLARLGHGRSKNSARIS